MIAKLLRPLGDKEASLNLLDDAAVIPGPGDRQYVVAKDAIVENVHFLPDDPPSSIGWKLLAVNLSDLAAMGATPCYYLTALTKTQRYSDRWLEEFCGGLLECQSSYGVSLIGGDTVSSQSDAFFSCTVIGSVPSGEHITRRQAKAGDLIFVTGTLGEASIGLRILKGLAVPDIDEWHFVKRYHRPQPRLELGQALRGIAHAMIDVSDGLLADLGHICDASSLGAEIDIESLPIAEEARRLPRHHQAALAGGDDYELLFTIHPDNQDMVVAKAGELGLPVTQIGRMTQTAGIRLHDFHNHVNGQNLKGWQHF